MPVSPAQAIAPQQYARENSPASSSASVKVQPSRTTDSSIINQLDPSMVDNLSDQQISKLKSFMLSQAVFATQAMMTTYPFWVSARKSLVPGKEPAPSFSDNPTWFLASFGYACFTDYFTSSFSQVGIVGLRVVIKAAIDRCKQNPNAHESKLLAEFLASFLTANITAPIHAYARLTRQIAQIDEKCMPLVDCQNFESLQDPIMWTGQFLFYNVFLTANYAIDQSLDRCGVYNKLSRLSMEAMGLDKIQTTDRVEERTATRRTLEKYFGSVDKAVEMVIRGALGAGVGAISGSLAYPFDRVRGVATVDPDMQWSDVPKEFNFIGAAEAIQAFAIIGATFGFAAHFLNQTFPFGNQASQESSVEITDVTDAQPEQSQAASSSQYAPMDPSNRV